LVVQINCPIKVLFEILTVCER